jgi:hypothetical protein
MLKAMVSISIFEVYVLLFHDAKLQKISGKFKPERKKIRLNLASRKIDEKLQNHCQGSATSGLNPEGAVTWVEVAPHS